MTEDVARLKLYLCMQTFKDVVQMPFLETVCDQALADLSFMEEELTACRVDMFIRDPGEHLVNLLEDKYLYVTNHKSAFLAQNHLSILPQKRNSFSDCYQNSSETHIDIAVYVISSGDDIKNAILDMKCMCESESFPQVLILFDSDGSDDIPKCQEQIAFYFATVGCKKMEATDICYLTYSSSGSIRAQRMMNNLQMVESNYLCVKQKLRSLAQSGLKKRFYTQSLNPFLYLTMMCKETLDTKITVCQKMADKIQSKAQSIKSIPSKLQTPAIRKKSGNHVGLLRFR